MQTRETETDPEIAVARQAVRYAPQTFAIIAVLELLCLLAPRPPMELMLAYASVGVFLFVVMVSAWRWRSTALRISGLIVGIFFILPKIREHSDLSFVAHQQVLLLMPLVFFGLLLVFRRAVVRVSRLEPVEPGRNLHPHGNS